MAQHEMVEVEVKPELVDEIWQLVIHERCRQRQLAERTGLPLDIVRAILSEKYRYDGDKVLVSVPNTVVRWARTTVATAAGERVKLIGTTTALPEYLITSRGGACMVPIDVEGEHYRIVVKRGRKPWMLKPRTMVGSIGLLKGDLLWAESFWHY